MADPVGIVIMALKVLKITFENGVQIAMDLSEASDEVRRCIQIAEIFRGSLVELRRLRCDHHRMMTGLELVWIDATISNANDALNQVATMLSQCKPREDDSIDFWKRVCWCLQHSEEFQGLQPLLEICNQRVLAAINSMHQYALRKEKPEEGLLATGHVDPHAQLTLPDATGYHTGPARPDLAIVSLEVRVARSPSLIGRPHSRDYSRLSAALPATPPRPCSLALAAAPEPVSCGSLENRVRTKPSLIVPSSGVAAGINSLFNTPLGPASPPPGTPRSAAFESHSLGSGLLEAGMALTLPAQPITLNLEIVSSGSLEQFPVMSAAPQRLEPFSPSSPRQYPVMSDVPQHPSILSPSRAQQYPVVMSATPGALTG